MKRTNLPAPREYIEEGYSLVAEDPEDMWHAYNLISVGDFVYAHAVRKVAAPTTDGALKGSGTTERVHTNLSIHVKSTFFDPAISSLRVSGTVASENDVVAQGLHHTLDLEVNRPFALRKPEGWDSVALATLDQALSDDKNGAVAAVVMQEGLANICLITQFRTVLKVRVEHVIPKKRDGSADQKKGMTKFFDKVLTSLTRAIDFKKPRPLLLASPGFVATDFKKYIETKGREQVDKVLMEVAKVATVVHSNSGHLHSLNEILKSPEVLAQMKDMKFAKEAQYMDNFFDLLKKDDGTAWYGTAAVQKAVAEGAVGPGGGVLLLNNSLFRSEDLAVRKKYVSLVDKVHRDGGEARILSSDHESGQRLHMMGDIAAILSYPMHDLDDDEEDDAQNGEVNQMQRHRDEAFDEDMLQSVI
ncbi:hypothetical protein NLU13_3754 [Sarocladium strictum]|uniref:Protein DOM34 homolog n=1 Tax=Sarocladium strictum TaxID=5046 RepID=A0AA39LAJ7_SARSR|nr:hypothetical protein NLU13_7109 [Sarocladium strictum]KAK0390182.1 hypothetical protein NLU13_3754 [Sarocladium strictum]